LCIAPKGYEYSYHYPWNGKPFPFVIEHKYIGVASEGDIIPNIFKAGMVLSDSGIAYGDADTDSNWVNPTQHAWDDFDWIRFACQDADDEVEAVDLLTKEAVDKLHATGVSENLFVVGPKTSFVIEGDAFHYNVKEIQNGVVAMSNCPKEFWRTQIRKRLPIASSFNIEKSKYVGKYETIRLNSLYGVRIIDIKQDFIIIRQIPFFKIVEGKIIIKGIPVKIQLGERETVGDFSVELFDIKDGKAKILVNYKYKAWENRMMNHIKPHYGSITIKDMINWSRLHEDDLDGLRPMCQDKQNESVAVYKIPKENYGLLSSFWFAPNHGCSSIYVPVHICDSEIYDSYENGSAARLSMNLLDIYGHDTLTSYFEKIENVLIYENNLREQIAVDMIENNEDPSDFLTNVDINMQEQAWLNEDIWLEVSKISDETLKLQIIDIIDGMWNVNYTITIGLMEEALNILENLPGTNIIINRIERIISSINLLTIRV
jgi:hypothetical protein